MLRNKDCWYKDVCKLECVGCMRYKVMSLLITQSDIPLQKTYNLSTNNVVKNRLTEIKHNIEDFVKSGYSIAIISESINLSNCGIRLMLSYFDKVWHKSGIETCGKFVFMPEFFDKIKNFDENNENYIETLKTCELVVFDNLPSTMTQFEKKQFDLILKYRLLQNKSCIITTNNKNFTTNGIENIHLEINKNG